jgi:methyltransferase (TIGR00027 family)
MAYEMVRRTGITMVPRTVAIDDAVRAHGAPQVVVLGAGLDSRAWRMPELAQARVFEVDHPASQRDKTRRVAGRAPVAARVLPVAVDLSTEPLAPALETAGLDPTVTTTWVWEGVVPYLTADAVRTTARAVADLSAPGCRLVVGYQDRSLMASSLRRIVRVAMRITGQADPLGHEPWRSLWSPSAMRDLLEEHGFHVRSDRDLLTLAEGLDLPPTDTGSLRNGRVAVADLTG